MTKEKQGFTLVELLVVISIIAVLLAILIPSLNKARETSREVICRSNLKQLGLCYSMYTGENNGNFESGVDFALTDHKMWLDILRPYYRDVDQLRCCPTAPAPKAGEKLVGGYGTATKYWVYNDEYGSYAVNGWLSNPKPGYWPSSWGAPIGEKGLWRNAYQKGANNIPILADAVWFHGLPLDTDMASQYKDRAQTANFNMQRFGIARHGMAINVDFLDWSVRKVRLKQLWRLKWHRQFDTNAAARKQWPAWMAGLPE